MKVLLWKNLVCLVLNSILFFSMVLTNMYGYSKLMFCEYAITNVYVCSIVVWVFFSNFEEGGPRPRAGTNRNGGAQHATSSRFEVLR